MRAIFVGLARDSAAHLPAVLKNIELLAMEFSESAYMFVENDSRDNTKQILSTWGSTRRNVCIVNLDGLMNVKARTIRIEIARNTYREMILSDSFYHGFDCIVVLDLDDINSQPFEVDGFRQAMDFLMKRDDVAAVCSNQRGPYYDLWALRHHELCPTDVWEDVFDSVNADGAAEQASFDRHFKSRQITISEDAAPIQVDSAFGGVGVYRVVDFLKNKSPYVGSKIKRVRSAATKSAGLMRWQMCEHVSFNYGFKALNKAIYIIPAFINLRAHSYIVEPSSYRGLIGEIF